MHSVPAGIAQLVEHLTCNQRVPSSTLGAGTIHSKARSVSKHYGLFAIWQFAPTIAPSFVWVVVESNGIFFYQQDLSG